MIIGDRRYHIWQQGLECSVDLLNRYNKVYMVILLALQLYICQDRHCELLYGKELSTEINDIFQ